MQVLRTRAEIQALSAGSVFVPTMGALHDGHMALVDHAKALGGPVVVSIFVNPTQFGPNEDLAKYPRPIEDDLALCEEHGVAAVFLPTEDVIYPHGYSARVEISGPSEGFEGAHRPGHFDGVATVVLTLFNLIRPHIAVFGEKDLQQCAVLKRMVDALAVPVTLSFAPTIREQSGLALSSRNRYFSPDQRARAVSLFQQLVKCRESILCGESVEYATGEAKQTLANLDFNVEYLALVHRWSFTPQSSPSNSTHLIVAAKFEGVRLIDNIPCLRP